MGCKSTSILMGRERILKFDCDGCKHGASIEQSEACMREVVNRLAEDPGIDAVSWPILSTSANIAGRAWKR